MPKGLDPKIFADHLVSLDVKARIDERPEGWAVWIHNEDHVARARDELRAYLDNPDDPKFRDDLVRRRRCDAGRRSATSSCKNFREVTDLWAAPGFRRRPLTFALMAICVVVYLLQRSSLGDRLMESLFFTTFYMDDLGGCATTASAPSSAAKSGGSSLRSSCIAPPISCISSSI